MTDPRPITCGDVEVTGLLGFVGARLAHDRHSPAFSVSEADALDVCGLADHLLEVAKTTCHPDFPCVLPDPHIDALALVAVLHDEHPDFNPMWLRRLSWDVEH